ncbi:DUF6069 family protein [Kutzneria sp. 744]|uniref:DUF6069 family protein n=1 Tax=Kutzneria sp. (strain 744) TaxID=345341 RepID=UPI0003EEA844|nr:DUF6069 family protein [Kutzneria sp. 744]EWM19391.1 hypothetical protein KUTG_09695 [Kutzneria sp. 744]
MDTTVTARRTLPVWAVSVLALLVAAVVTEIYGLLLPVVGIPMIVGSVFDTVPSAITVGMFAMGCAVSGFWGTILAVLIARFARKPARTYVVTTSVLVAVSLIAPLAGVGPLSTRVALAVAHLIAAAIVIPAVGRRLS